LPGTERGVRIAGHGMLGAKHGQDGLIVMTLETRIGAFLAVLGRVIGGRYGRSCESREDCQQREEAAEPATLGRRLQSGPLSLFAEH